jgi:predicted RNA-binding protein Jag
MEWVEITGPTIEDARERALDRLGVDISDADVEVLQEPGRAMFGLRKIDARVRARVRPTAPPPRQERHNRRPGQSKRGGRDAQGPKGSGSRSGAKKSDDAASGRTSKGDGSSKPDAQRNSRTRGSARSDGGSPANSGNGSKKKQGSSKSASGGAGNARQDGGDTDAVVTRKRSRTLSATSTAGAPVSKSQPSSKADSQEPSSKRSRTRSLAATDIDTQSGSNIEPVAVSSDREVAPVVRRRQRKVAGNGSDNAVSKISKADETGATPVQVDDSRDVRVRRLKPSGRVTAVDGSSARQDQQEVSESQEETVMEEVSVDEQGAMVVEFLDGLVEAFGVTASAAVVATGEDSVDVAVTGDSLGLLIGPGGHTLSALTEVTKTVLQRQNNGASRARVRLDVAGYRERRRAALDVFTREVAESVKSSGEARALEPMHSADRKVVHDTANDIDGVGTVSDGDEPRRRVVIVPEG